MQRTTFPEDRMAWRKEVERMLQSHAVDIKRLTQLDAPQTSGVVIGGNPPVEKLCMSFDFTIGVPGTTTTTTTTSTSSTTPLPCASCDCWSMTVSGFTGMACIGSGANGTFVLRQSLSGYCVWSSPITDLQQQWVLNYDGVRYGLIFYGGILGGSSVQVIYYSNPVSPPCASSITLTLSSLTAGTCLTPPNTITVTSVPCATTTTSTTGSTTTGSTTSTTSTTTAECPSTLDIHAEIKWDSDRFDWVQSYFSINGAEGGGTVQAAYNGATFQIDFAVAHRCFVGSATYLAPVYVDDACRPVTARRSTKSDGWPTHVTGACFDCTPTSTTSTESTTTESTTTASTTTASTTTASTTTASTTTASTTTGSTTTGSTTTESTTTESTTGSTTTASTTTGTTTGSTTTASTTTSTTTPSCGGSCFWVWHGVWSETSETCTGGCACGGRKPTFNGIFDGQQASTSCG